MRFDGGGGGERYYLLALPYFSSSCHWKAWWERERVHLFKPFSLLHSHLPLPCPNLVFQTHNATIAKQALEG
jgi:hypothetical protein